MSEDRKKYRILLLDPDEGFNLITANVLRKAGFHLLPAFDYEGAIQLYEQTIQSENTIDLLILSKDSGLSLIKEIKLKQPQLSFLVIANDWTKEEIKEYISLGVSGIYKKPINLFAMIDRIKELVYRQFHNTNEFVWKLSNNCSWNPKSFSGSSKNSRKFLDELWKNKNFKNSLVIEVPPGAPLELVVTDMQSTEDPASERWVQVEGSDLEIDFLENLYSECTNCSELESLTIVIADAMSLNVQIQDLLCEFILQASSLENKNFSVRLLLFTSKNFDTAYEDGLLSDRFYMSSGSLTIKFPALEDCPEELHYFLQYYLSKLAVDHSLEDWTWISMREAKALVKDPSIQSFNAIQVFAEDLFKKTLSPDCSTTPEEETIEIAYRKYLKEFAEVWVRVSIQIVGQDKEKLLEELSISESDLSQLKI